jgi:hypothetical protein
MIRATGNDQLISLGQPFKKTLHDLVLARVGRDENASPQAGLGTSQFTSATSVHLQNFLFFILALPVYVLQPCCTDSLQGPKYSSRLASVVCLFFFFFFSRFRKGWTRPPVQQPRTPICGLHQRLGGLPTARSVLSYDQMGR